MWLAPRAALRKGHVRGNARWHPPARARVRRSENVPVRRCLKNCCRSRKAVAIGPRDLPPSQADRCAGPSARRADALRATSKDGSKDTRDKGSRWSERGRKGTGSWSANDRYFAVHRTRETGCGSSQGHRDDGRDHDGWFVGGLLLLAPADRARSREAPRREEAPCDGRRPGSSQRFGFHDRAVMASSACTRSIDDPRESAARSAREGDRDVRGRSSSSTRG